MRLNDIPVGRKLFIIYITGVLLPLIIINSLIINRFQHRLTEQYLAENSALMDRAASRMGDMANNGNYVLQKFFTDRGLYRILNTDYPNNRDFVNIYNDLFASTVLSFLPFYEDISSFMLYTTNPSVLNGGSVRFITDDISRQPWYVLSRELQRSFIIPWIGSNQEDARQDLHVSIVHPLNYYSSFDRYYNFMKADIKLASLNKIFAEISSDSDLLLLDSSGRVILSSDGREALSPFDREKESFRGKYMLERSLEEELGSPWLLIGFFPQKPDGRELLPSDWMLPLIGLVLLVNSSLSIWWVSRSLTVRLNRLTEHIRSQSGERMTTLEGRWKRGNDEIGGLIENFNQMSRRINQLVHDVYASELTNREIVMERQKAELHALQSQVNPHYLFNILESVRMKSVLKGEDETAEILQLLSASFRRMFTWGKDLVPLGESLVFLEEYLMIQRYRLGDRLSYRIQCDDSLKTWPIPKLIIQPLVENSCRHGFREDSEDYRLNLRIEKVSGWLQVTVEDNGVGMEAMLVEEIQGALDSREEIGRFVGLRNVRSRLRARYGESLFEIISRPGGGTRIVFHIGGHEGAGL